ncbi:MAG: LamG-like jellyroll fold domain-containing protein [Rhodoglobus sp.]
MCVVLAAAVCVLAPTTAKAVESAPKLACAEVQGDARSASDVASRCGHDVEVSSARTEWNTLFAEANGTMRLVVSAGAVRTRSGSADWVPVDSSIVTGPDGFKVASPVTEMVFSDGTSDVPLARIERNGHELSFDVPFDLPAPVASGSQLTYLNVLPGVDLIVTVHPDATGFSEVFRVASPAAASDPRLGELAFPVDVSAGLDLVAEGGGFVVRTADGESVFTSPTPAMWDSAAPASLGASPQAVGGLKSLLTSASQLSAASGEVAVGDRTIAPLGSEAVAWMPATVSDGAVSVVPDPGLLNDPATVWPVYIDPSVSGSLNQWTAVRDAYSPAYNFNPDQGVGLCSRATSSTCSTTFKSRLLWQFAGLDAVGALDPSQVISATFAAVGTHSYDCTARPVTLYGVADFDVNTPWPGGGYWAPLSTQVVAHKAACADQPVRWIEFPATSHAQAIAAANTTLGSFGLAADESSMAYWKRYRYDATFSVTYNRPPNIPAGVKFTNPAVPCAMGTGRPYVRVVAPTIYGVLSDPDGQNVQANVDVYTAGTVNPILWHGRPAAQGSGAGQAVQVGGMVDGGIYRVQMNAVDSDIWGGAAVACEVAVDLSAPALPGVGPVTGQPAVYLANETSGGVGVVGKFAFTNGGSPDVARYKYSFNSSALDLSATAAAPVAMFNPTLVGSQTLFVQSVDRAGWTSAVVAYRFSVAFAGASGTWLLNEGTGTSSADSSGGAKPLTVSATTAWTGGVLADFEVNVADRALQFDAASDSAATASRVVATDGTFTVMAFVKLDDKAGTYTAVSQNGVATSGFELGHRVDAACPTGTGTCWGMWMNTTDSASAGTPVRALSSVPVRAGSWVQLTGVHIKGADTMQLTVCELGSPSSPGTQEPQATGLLPFHASWNAVGPLQIGRGQAWGLPARSWHGGVGEVRAFTGALTLAQIRTSCQNPG